MAPVAHVLALPNGRRKGRVSLYPGQFHCQCFSPASPTPLLPSPFERCPCIPQITVLARLLSRRTGDLQTPERKGCKGWARGGFGSSEPGAEGLHRHSALARLGLQGSGLGPFKADSKIQIHSHFAHCLLSLL
uniref:Uncharacterized protein n=1 Tax=Crocodylus porosus TaxID=8502 RepID=A0A7M4E478_CROPO